MSKLLKFLLFLCLASPKLYAQEIQANVQILHDRVQGVDATVFATLKNSLQEFVNTRKWTSDFYKPAEKIQVNFLINITETIGGEKNLFKATLNVQASRPVYNTGLTSPTFTFFDRDVAFKYDQTSIIQFDDNRVSGSEALSANLPAIMAYYCYMVLGFDYDSFAKLGGSPYFRKAQNIVSNAPEDTKSIIGWKSSDNNNKNRFWLVEQIQGPRYRELRDFYYQYHINGMDKMQADPLKAQSVIVPLFSILQKINKENPSSIYLQTIFNTKSNEFANIVSALPITQRQEIAKILAEVDVPNAAKYRDIK